MIIMQVFILIVMEIWYKLRPSRYCKFRWDKEIKTEAFI